MASIRKEVVIDATPEEVWDALRDWRALHKRLVPGFATDAHVEANTRIVTFFTGTVLREAIVTIDDEERRLVWSILDPPYEHHNASAQVLAERDGRARFVWLADVLPDEVAPGTSEMMERGSRVIKETLSSVEAAT